MASLEEIGRALKDAREARGISLQAIADHTRITMRHLRAIEAGEVSELPELFYVRGFLKKYAELVGLPPDRVADAYAPAPIPVPTQPPVRVSLGPFAYHVVVALALAGAIALAWKLQPRLSVISDPPPPSPIPSPRATFGPPPLSALLPPMVAIAPPRVASAASGLVEIILLGQERSYIEVKVDGKAMYEGPLGPGEKRRFAGRQLEVGTDNGGGVRLERGGKDQGPLGPAGQPVSRVIAP